MACSGFRHPLRTLVRESATFRDVPTFLAPGVCHAASRQFSTSQNFNSRIGKEPISIPAEVTLRFYDLPRSNVRSRKADMPSSAVEVTGPLGMRDPKVLEMVQDIDNNRRIFNPTTSTIHLYQIRRRNQKSFNISRGRKDSTSESHVG